MASEAFGQRGRRRSRSCSRAVLTPAARDNVFEVLVRAGRAAPMAKSLLDSGSVGEIAHDEADAHRALYAYCNAVMEPWDGPQRWRCSMAARRLLGLDRNGLRLTRYALTEDGLLVGRALKPA